MSKKSNSSSSVGNYSNVVRLASFWAMLFTAIAELLSFIFFFFDPMKAFAGTLNFIGNILLIIAIGLGAWDYVKGKKQVWRVLFIIALIVLIVFRVLNFGGWFK